MQRLIGAILRSVSPESRYAAIASRFGNRSRWAGGLVHFLVQTACHTARPRGPQTWTCHLAWRETGSHLWTVTLHQCNVIGRRPPILKRLPPYVELDFHRKGVMMCAIANVIDETIPLLVGVIGLILLALARGFVACGLSLPSHLQLRLFWTASSSTRRSFAWCFYTESTSRPAMAIRAASAYDCTVET